MTKMKSQSWTEGNVSCSYAGCARSFRQIRHNEAPEIQYLSDADPKNAFDMEKHLKRRPAIVKPDEVFDYYEIDAADLQEDADHEET